MHLNQIRYVLEVQRCGSFSGAAKHLFVSQPTLSQQILALEQELQVNLFVRHQRGVTLTDAGVEFALFAHRITSEITNLLDSMHSYASLAKGKVKVGVLWIFADLGLPGLLSSFQSAYPAIEMNIIVNGSVKLLEMLKNREVDAAFFIGPSTSMQPDDLYVVKMYSSDMMMVLPATHRLAQIEELHLSDLANENIVLPARDSSIHDPLMAHFQSLGIMPNVIAKSSQTDVILACAEYGMAISFVSDSIAKTHANANTVIRPFTPVIKREVFYAALKDTLVIPSVHMLTEYIAKSSPFHSKRME